MKTHTASVASVASVVSAVREAADATPYARGDRFVAITHSRLMGYHVTLVVKPKTESAWERRTFVVRSPDGTREEVPATKLNAWAKEVARG